MPNTTPSPSPPDGSPTAQVTSARSRRVDASGSRKPRARFAADYERLLEKLITARKAAGIRQEVIAKALGKTQSHVSMCESREREISIIDLWKWCLVLGIPLSDFISELEKEGVPPLYGTDEG